jgi:uncharacterized protein YgfB (UPF0149 family)
VRHIAVIPGSATSTLDYDRLRDSLADSGAVVALAELHGAVCGALCGGGAPAAQRWIAECLEEQEPNAATALVTRDLDDLVAATWRGLSDPELKFAPLLPGDDAPLQEQVQALALWCHGFLSGLGASSPAGAGGDGSTPEILGDFAEISRAGLSDEEAAGHGQPDFALAEIQEYVRVSAQIVFEELAGQRTAAQRDSH